jgi:APA family basic amino acid/polyamine antiporter
MAERGVGHWAGTWIVWAAAIAGLATLNGWILMAGRIPVAAAQDGLFFAGLGRVHPRLGTPVTGLLIGSGIASLALLLALHDSLLDAFNSIVALAVLTTLLYLARLDPSRFAPAERRRAAVVALLAFAAVLFFMYGCGPTIALWGFLVIFAGTPIYVWLRTPGSRSRIL